MSLIFPKEFQHPGVHIFFEHGATREANGSAQPMPIRNLWRPKLSGYSPVSRSKGESGDA
jgi:hypothetical protein